MHHGQAQADPSHDPLRALLVLVSLVPKSARARLGTRQTKSCYVQLGMSTEKMAAEQRILTVSVLFLSLSALAATFQCRGFLLLLLMNLARFGELANVT